MKTKQFDHETVWLIVVCSITVVIVMLLAGCGGKQVKIPETKASTVPDWYLKPPKSEDYIYAPATATKRSQHHAVTTAEHRGEVAIARRLEDRVIAMFKDFSEEAGEGDAATLALTTDASKTVTTATLHGWDVKEKAISFSDGNYSVYVLIELPLATVNAQLLARIKAERALYTRFRATEAFAELNKTVEKYEQFKESQAAVPEKDE